MRYHSGNDYNTISGKHKLIIECVIEVDSMDFVVTEHLLWVSAAVILMRSLSESSIYGSTEFRHTFIDQAAFFSRLKSVQFSEFSADIHAEENIYKLDGWMDLCFDESFKVRDATCLFY